MGVDTYIKTERFVSEEFLNVSYTLPKDSICFTSIASVGKMCMTSTKSISNQQINSIIVNDNYVPKYVYYNLMYLVPKIKAMAAGGIVPIINKEEFSNIILNTHAYNTQEKLATLLSLIDDLIAHNEERLQVNKEILMAYYQQIVKNEPTWKVQKINDIFKVTRGSVLSKKDISLDIGDYPVYSSQTLNKGLLGYYSEYLYENAITWTTDGANAGDVNYRHGKFYCTNVCGVLISDYYANTFNAFHLNTKTRNYVSYVGNPKLMNNVMENIVTSFPEPSKSLEYSILFDAINDRNKMIIERVDGLKQIKQHYLNVIFK